LGGRSYLEKYYIIIKKIAYLQSGVLRIYLQKCNVSIETSETPLIKSASYNVQTEEQRADYRAENNCFGRHYVGYQFVELPHIAEMEMRGLGIPFHSTPLHFAAHPITRMWYSMQEVSIW